MVTVEGACNVCAHPGAAISNESTRNSARCLRSLFAASMICPRPSRSYNNSCLNNRPDGLFQHYNKGDTDAAIFIVTLFKNFEKIAVIVRPQTHSSFGIERCGFTEQIPLKSGFRRCKEDPVAANDSLRNAVC